VSLLVVVLPLRNGTREKARALLKHGPPFDLEATEIERHEVYLTEREVIFVFESSARSATVRLPGEDLSLWKAAAAWQRLIAGKPRKGETAYSWIRSENGEGISFEPTPGPGDSEGGDVFPPAQELAPSGPPH
jgi:hypothetical protein